MSTARCMVATLLIGAILLVACDGGASEERRPSGTAAATTAPPAASTEPPRTEPLPATASPAPRATSVPMTVTPTAAPASPIIGMFTEPRPPRLPDLVVSWPALPPSFTAHNGETTVLYDFAQGEQTSFGPGSTGAFSPDSRYMMWINAVEGSDPPAVELHVLDLGSGAIRDLGPREFDVNSPRLCCASFVDGRTVKLSDDHFIDAVTGERVAAPEVVIDATSQPGGSVDWRSLEAVVPTSAADRTVAFEELQWSVTVAGPNLVVILESDETPSNDYDTPARNLFLLDLDGREATFITTLLVAYGASPFGVSGGYFVWTEDICGPDPRVLLYDLDRDRLVEIGRPSGAMFYFVGFTSRGYLMLGWENHVVALLDPETLSYLGRLPEGYSSVSWSPDGRFASRGGSLPDEGHGPCI